MALRKRFLHFFRDLPGQRWSHICVHKLKEINVLRITNIHKLNHIQVLRITYRFILYTFHSKQNGKEDMDTLGTRAVRTVHVMLERSCSIYSTLVAKRVFKSH